MGAGRLQDLASQLQAARSTRGIPPLLLFDVLVDPLQRLKRIQLMHDTKHDSLCKIYQLSVPLLNYDLVKVLLCQVWRQKAAISSWKEVGIRELLLARSLLYLLKVLAQHIQD